MMLRLKSFRCAAAVFALIVVGAVRAQGLSADSPIEALEGIGIDQKLDAQVPLDLPFVDEYGDSVQLADYFGEKPVVLTLVYYECPMLCTEILNGTLRAVRAMNFEVGREFEIVTVSIDPGEAPPLAAEKKAYYARAYGRSGGESGWHFLTGSADSIQKLADAVGFRYRYDPKTDLYTHASAIMALTPEGRVSRYFLGVDYAPRDLRLGLVEASQNKIGSPVDQVMLYCFHYDPATGKYTVAIMSVLRLAGVATILILGGFIVAMIVRERRARPVRPSGDAVTVRR